MEDNYKLCHELLSCDSESDVILLLKERGYWDKPELWRFYGDVENNWGQSGNQMKLAEVALVEKIVNSVDARLTNECLIRGIDPAGPNAPKSIQEAVARFFANGTGSRVATGGLIENWGDIKIREVAEGITFCVTGVRPEQLSITIADCGEGQTPNLFPDTILSLSKSNKMYIPFVQGQFNQGGSGVLRFCGEKNFQLVVSRRNPKLLKKDSTERDQQWGFTIVRRERPSGSRKISRYTYLAPVGADTDKNAHKGRVLSFEAESFRVFPNDDGPYSREAIYGTAVKMFDYRYLGEKSNILRGNSLLSRLDLRLPKIALPVRLYEYRKSKKGDFLDVGSRRTTLSGLQRRLVGNPNVERNFPISIPLYLEGEEFIVHIFVFRLEGATNEKNGKNKNAKSKKRGGSRSYRRREGVVFVQNGQTQGDLPKDFFRRDAVKMKSIADDLLVFVECDGLSDVAREDLFMSSRDRLVESAFKQSLVARLEQSIRDCQELRDLRNQRQQERMSEHVKEEQPFVDVLQSLMKNSPNLKTLLQLGGRISASFDTRPTGSDKKKEFKGEFYPNYFKTKGVEYGVTFKRLCPINRSMRLIFETDARDDYFTRSAERGVFTPTWIAKDGKKRKVSLSGPRLKSGIATVMLDLPDDVTVGDDIEFIALVNDTLSEFENRTVVSVKPKTKIKDNPSGSSKSPRRPGPEDGKRREQPLALSPPRIKRVYRKEWDNEGFDAFTAMKVEHLSYLEDEEAELYIFKVNMDNAPLENEAKQKRLDSNQYNLLRQQFLYANVLIGLSLLLDEKQNKPQKEAEGEVLQESVEERINSMCRALAPFLPALISLRTEDIQADDQFEGLEEAV